MEETHLVIYDLNQSSRVNWEEMGMEEGWGEAMWQAGMGDTKIWRWVSNGMGVCDVWGNWECLQDLWEEG